MTPEQRTTIEADLSVLHNVSVLNNTRIDAARRLAELAQMHNSVKEFMAFENNGAIISQLIDLAKSFPEVDERNSVWTLSSAVYHLLGIIGSGSKQRQECLGASNNGALLPLLVGFQNRNFNTGPLPDLLSVVAIYRLTIASYTNLRKCYALGVLENLVNYAARHYASIFDNNQAGREARQSVSFALGTISAILTLAQPKRYGEFPDMGTDEPLDSKTISQDIQAKLQQTFNACHAFLVDQRDLLTNHNENKSPLIQLLGFLNAVLLLNGQDDDYKRIKWLTDCSMKPRGNESQNTLFDLYVDILAKNPAAVSDANKSIQKVINTTFFRLYQLAFPQGEKAAYTFREDVDYAGDAERMETVKLFMQMRCKLRTTCSNPGCGETKDLGTCSCALTKYCGKDCQREHAEVHLANIPHPS